MKFPSKPSPLKERTVLGLKSDMQHHVLLIKKSRQLSREFALLFSPLACGFPVNKLRLLDFLRVWVFFCR